ncbi:sensor histidine kinase [Tellurirhabdus rosea]|uniref:sensor histidine kinase n=1 Tax=Tellurirhabdus rosea TaxID=2674997 RepID=UPI0022551EBA|nr:two-component regulator propeller domain-containing protein [Tellurirhabdus rosea]
MSRFLWFLGVVGVLLVSGNRALAQLSDPAFEHYTTEDGLSNDQVKCLLKDRRGFLWFGTFNGLNRFDGYEFKVYKRTATNGLPGNYVIGLTEDPQGYIWVATHRGLCRFDPVRETFTPVRLAVHADRLGDNDLVSGLVIDRQGQGWFSSIDSLYRIDLRTMRCKAFPNVGHTPYLMPIVLYPFADRKGRLWLQNEQAIYQFHPSSGRYTYIFGRDTRHPRAAEEVWTFHEDRQGQMWFATGTRGLMRYDESQKRVVNEPDGEVSVYNVAEGMSVGKGRRFFWVYRDDKGLMLYYPDRRRYVPVAADPQDPLAYHGGPVNEILNDAQTGIVWLATDKGIEKADAATLKFGRKRLTPDRPSSENRSMRIVRQDRFRPELYWMAVQGAGLVRWNRRSDEYTVFDRKDGLPDEDIRDLVQDARGRLWLGLTGGISRWTPGTRDWKHWRGFFRDPSQTHRVTRLWLDSTGRLWLGTDLEGLYVLDDEQAAVRPWPVGETFDHLRPFRVYKMQEDGQHRLWASTSRGLFRIDYRRGESRKVALNPLSEQLLPSDKIQTTFTIDSRNRLWVSGIGFLAQADLNGRVLRTFTLENGLQADHIFDIQEDRSGRLWMTTDYFLHQLEPQTGRFRYFSKDNGLFSNFMSTRLTADARGELFIGHGPAFNHFVPEKLPVNRYPPPVVLTGVRVDTLATSVIPGEPVTLRPDQHTVSLEFTALSFSQPEKNRYAYRLDGVDPGWIETGSRRVTYANLDPGTYTFRVKAANNDGIWNERGATLQIRVQPAVYQTWWFRLGCLLLVAGLLYAVYRNRLQQRRRLEGIRDRIATDLHDDMGSTLSSIRIFSDVVQQQIAPVSPETVPILQRISSSATTLSESMQDIIWTIQTKYDSLDDVVTRMREFGLRMAEAKNIRFRMQVSEKFETLRLDVEQRRNLYLIFKESINNAVKYADCRNITVQIALLNKHLSLTIEDDGKGFDPATVRPGNGLPNLQKRAREINGQLTVHSAPGEGTRVVLLVRV